MSSSRSFLALVVGVGVALTQNAVALEDVLGRPVPLGEGRPAIVFYANRATRDELWQEGLPFAFAERAHRPIIVVHVDLSRVPGLLKGLAHGRVKSSWRDSAAAARKYFAARGVDVDHSDPADSMFFVADDDGEPHRRRGLPSGFDAPYAEVRGPQGRTLAGGTFPAVEEKLSQSLDQLGPAP